MWESADGDTRGSRLHIGVTVVDQRPLQESHLLIQENTVLKAVERKEKQSNWGTMKKQVSKTDLRKHTKINP